MKNILKAFLIVLAVSIGIFGQNSVDNCCCTPEPIQFSGTITAGDSPSTYLVSQRMVNVALWKMDNFTTVYVGELRVNTLGQFGVTVQSCSTYILQPHVTGRGMSQFPRYVDIYEPGNFLILDAYQSQTDLNTTMTMLYIGGRRGTKDVR